MGFKLSYEFDIAGICRLSVHAGVKNIGIYLRPFPSPLDRRRQRTEILSINLLVFLLVEEEGQSDSYILDYRTNIS